MPPIDHTTKVTTATPTAALEQTPQNQQIAQIKEVFGRVLILLGTFILLGSMGAFGGGFLGLLQMKTAADFQAATYVGLSILVTGFSFAEQKVSVSASVNFGPVSVSFAKK